MSDIKDNPILKNLLGQSNSVLQKCEMAPDEENALKVDCNTALESTFLVLGIIFIVFGLMILFIFVVEEDWFFPDYVLPGIFAVGAFFLILRKLTDIYYLIDRMSGEILIHRRIVLFQSRTRLCSFSDVVFVVALGKRYQTKGGAYWNYHLALLLSSGKQIRLSDPQRAIDMAIFKEPGERIAQWINTRYLQGPIQHELKIEQKPVMGESDLTWISEDQLRKQSVKSAVIIIVLFMVIPFGVILALVFLGYL